MREILAAVGEDPNREGLRETPRRVARMYAEMFSGLHENPRTHLQKFFTEKYDEMVLVRDISFDSMCEHHMLPFSGVAHIGYIPNGKVVGLSKLARVVEVVSHRPQVQERMTEDIANLLIEELDVKGVAVVIEATHSCMTIRGVRKPGSVCVTSAMKGVFRSSLSSRCGSDESHLRQSAVSESVHADVATHAVPVAAHIWSRSRHGGHVAAAGIERLLSQPSVRDAGALDAGCTRLDEFVDAVAAFTRGGRGAQLRWLRLLAV